MSLVAEAERLAVLLRVDAGPGVQRIRATHDVGLINPAPCLLVEPVPTRHYDATLCEGAPFTVTWRVIALAPAPAGLAAAQHLDRLVDHAGRLLAAEGLVPVQAIPAAYVPGAGGESSFPAVIITFEGDQTWQ